MVVRIIYPMMMKIPPLPRLGGGVNFTRPLPKYSGEIRMDGFSWLTVSTNFHP